MTPHIHTPGDTSAYLHHSHNKHQQSPALRPTNSNFVNRVELELELIQTQMTQKPMLRAEVGMRVRCANKASAECIMRGRGIGQNSHPEPGFRAGPGNSYDAA